MATLKDKNLYNYFGSIKKYIEAGPMGYLIVENANYEDPKTIKALDGLIDLLSKRKGVFVPPWRIWY